jgi:hypothetical protein
MFSKPVGVGCGGIKIVFVDPVCELVMALVFGIAHRFEELEIDAAFGQHQPMHLSSALDELGTDDLIIMIGCPTPRTNSDFLATRIGEAVNRAVAANTP